MCPPRSAQQDYRSELRTIHFTPKHSQSFLERLKSLIWLDSRLTFSGSPIGCVQLPQCRTIMLSLGIDSSQTILPYPFISMVPQNVTEELLAQALERKGAEVEYNTRFFSMNESPDAVSVVIEKDGKQEQIRAKYVVGCDGAHSAVRRSLGITLDGGEYDMPFMLADIETNQDLPADELQLCSSAHGPIAIFPMSATRRRVVATVERTEGDAPTLEFTQRLLEERAPKGLFSASKLYWSSYFRIHHRHASQLRSGRVFLAGDAAHIHSPFGGQGMNTGLHDVWNLVWKLELAVRGHGSECSSRATPKNVYRLSRRSSKRLIV